LFILKCFDNISRFVNRHIRSSNNVKSLSREQDIETLFLGPRVLQPQNAASELHAWNELLEWRLKTRL
jgi:hypothetical protein